MVTRVILGVIGGVLLLCAIAAGVAAGWVYSTVGTAGTVRFDAGTISPGPTALATVIDVDRFQVSVPYLGSMGDVTLEVGAEGASAADPVFVGANRTEAADAFLAGVPYSAAYRVDGDWSVRDVPGGQAPPAVDSAAWLAQGTGDPAELTVPDARPISLVVLRPSGEPTGPLLLGIRFTMPDAQEWLLGLAIGAVVLLLVAVLLLVLAFRRRRPRGKHAAGAVVAPAETEVVLAEAAPADLEADAAETAVAETAVAETVAAETVTVAEVAAGDETAELPVVTEPPVDDATVELAQVAVDAEGEGDPEPPEAPEATQVEPAAEEGPGDDRP